MATLWYLTYYTLKIYKDTLVIKEITWQLADTLIPEVFTKEIISQPNCCLQVSLKKKEHYTTTFTVILNRIIEIVQNSVPRFFLDVKLLLLKCSYILVQIATCASASLAKDKHFIIRITYLNTCSQTVCGWYCLLNSFQFLSFMGSFPYMCAACTVTCESISDRWPVVDLLCELFTKPPWASVSAEV